MRSFLRSLLIIILLVTQFDSAARNLFAQSVNSQFTSDNNNLKARLANLEQTVETRRRELGIPGLALAIVKDNQIIYSQGFGLRNLEKNLPVTSETLFNIGSATKAFTAIATVMSADDGKLSLDDSPKKFLPFFKLRDVEADSKVNLRDLMSHRTGLDRTDFSFQFTNRITREDAIKIARLALPTAKFREKWQYQNTMFTAAGEAAARANNMTWEKLIAEKVFKPLGMKKTNTSFIELQKAKNFSFGYDYNPETKETRKLKIIDTNPIAPAGAINSNVIEMSRWLRLMLGGGVFEGKRLVSEKNFKELVTEQMPIAPGHGYGFGWFLDNWHGKKEVEHGGNNEGYSTMVSMLPEEHLGLVMLSNVSYSPLQDEIRDIVYSNLLGEAKQQAEAKKLNVSIAATSPALQEIIGNYESASSGKTINIVAKDNAVYLQIEGKPPFKLVENGTDKFALAGLPEGFFLSVKRNEAGKASALSFNQNGIVANLRQQVPLDIDINDLMNKIIEAMGGAANLRKHYSMRMETTINLEGEGMTAEGVINSKAPNLLASSQKFFALGKEVGETFEYFDGKSGGNLTTSGKQLVSAPLVKSGSVLEDARIAANFYLPLDWKTLYQKITVKKISKIGDEDVYVIEKTLFGEGHPVVEYVSQKTFLVLRRESFVPLGFYGMTAPYVENFSDFRLEDGVMMPHKIVAGIPHAGITETTVKSLEFNVKIPDSIFRPSVAAIK